MPFWLFPLFAIFGFTLTVDQVVEPPSVAPLTVERVLSRMERADARLYPGDRLPWIGNEQSRLGWTEAYALQAYVRAALLTGEARWRLKAQAHVTQVLQRTDHARHLPDYRGVVRTGWSAIDRSAQGERIVWLADTGHLGAAMLAVADLVDQQDPSAHAWAESVRDVVERALQEFESTWRPGPDGTGTYIYAADEPHAPGKGRRLPNDKGLKLTEVPLPWNQQLLAAQAMRRLAKTRPVWRARLEAVVRTWQQAWQPQADGGLSWTYWGAPVVAVYPNSEPVHYAGIGLGVLGDLLEDGDPLVTPAMQAAAVATAQRILTPQAMAIDLTATRWVPIPVPAGTSPGVQVQLAEWGRWYGGDCDRWRAALQTLWEAGESPSSWMGWMELLSVRWCAPVEAPPSPAHDPFRG